MLKKDKSGLKFGDYPEHESFIKKLEEIGFDIEGIIPFTRNTSFIREPCEICGGTKLIHGIGRYVIYDQDNEKSLAIFICGYCESHLSKDWKIELDFM